MKFHPILFSTPLVQAIQEGRKTMTRRLRGLEKINNYPGQWAYLFWKPTKEHLFYNQKNAGNKLSIKCPYGKVGDVLWVRETYHVNDGSGKFPDIEKKWYNYKADHLGLNPGPMWPPFDKWKPSIFMPKAACRIFLEITNVRVERLQDISERDAIKEGVKKYYDTEFFYCDYNTIDENHCDWKGNAYASFASLWESINGKESWEANPFVWVISFEKIDKPENFLL